MFSGTRPDNLGVKDGRFAACKTTPNCVSSQADPADGEHYITPIAYTGTMHELRQVIQVLLIPREIKAINMTKLIINIDIMALPHHVENRITGGEVAYNKSDKGDAQYHEWQTYNPL